MTVSEFIKWLQEFEDQDAIVQVVDVYSDGDVRVSKFDPAFYASYTDFRGNPYIEPGDKHYNARYLTLGDPNTGE
jgi:hypothetical protein